MREAACHPPTFEQEHVLRAVAAQDAKFAGPLLGGNDVQLVGKARDGHQRLARDVGARNGQLGALRAALQRRGDVLWGSKAISFTYQFLR